MKRNLAAFVLAFVVSTVLTIGSARAQTTVNQGKPSASTQGSWPVAINPAGCSATLSDGGIPYLSTTAGVASSTIPATTDKFRKYIVICNSSQNKATIPLALIKCRSDGTAPTMAVTNAGDVLAVGECIPYASNVYPTSQTVKCISDTATTYVTSFECL